MGDIPAARANREVSFEIDTLPRRRSSASRSATGSRCWRRCARSEGEGTWRRSGSPGKARNTRGRGRQSVCGTAGEASRQHRSSACRSDQHVEPRQENRRVAPDELKWTALTTGGFGGAGHRPWRCEFRHALDSHRPREAEVRIADVGARTSCSTRAAASGAGCGCTGSPMKSATRCN